MSKSKSNIVDDDEERDDYQMFDRVTLDNFAAESDEEEDDMSMSELDSSIEDLEAEEEERQRRVVLPLRDHIYKTITKPNWSHGAKVYAMINSLAVVVATAVALMGSFPSWQEVPVHQSILYIPETICIALFTFEYIARCILTRKHKLKWATEFLNVIDIISIFPYYLELVAPSSSLLRAVIVLRVLRLFRVFRLFKFAAQSSQYPVVTAAVKSSGAGFGMALFSVSLFCVGWAAAVYYAELSGSNYNSEGVIYYDDGTESPYQSIIHAMWWALVTMTTVGYGDVVPITTAGKIVASLALTNAIFVMAFPLTIIVSHFSIEYGKWVIEREIRKRHRLEKQEASGKERSTSSVKLLRDIWRELLTFKDALDTAKDKLEAFERQYKNMDLYVRRLDKRLGKEEVELTKILKKYKVNETQ